MQEAVLMNELMSELTATAAQYAEKLKTGSKKCVTKSLHSL